MTPPKPNGHIENHELLISVAGKVDSLAASLEKSISQSAAEFDKIWKHVDARDERLTNAITNLAEKQNNFGKPNIQAIVAVCVLIGSIAVAFIAPIKADIEREGMNRESLAKAASIRDEKIQAMQSADSEFREKQKAVIAKLEDVATNGSGLTRERLAVIESDLKWMRGEKKNLSLNN